MLDSFDALAAPALAWLLTWLLHGTVVLGLALLATRWLHRGAAEELILKAALLASLATATAATAAGDDGAALAPRAFESTVSGAAATPVPVPVPAPATFGPGVAAPPWLALPAGAWTHLACVLWLLGALAHGVVLAGGWLRLRATLRGRTAITRGPLADALAELRPRRRVHLTESARLATPIAFGWLRPEICVPACAATALSRAAQRAMLAHELAHLTRWDPAWSLGLRGLGCLLFAQPLLGALRRRLLAIAEARCDHAAVAATGDSLPLAEALLAVAEWLAAAPAARTAAPAVPMAAHGSALGQRIRALCAPPAPPARVKRGIRLGAAALALCSGALLPAVAVPPPPAATAATSEVQALRAELQALQPELEALRVAASAAGAPDLADLAAALQDLLVKLDRRCQRLLARWPAPPAGAPSHSREPERTR